MNQAINVAKYRMQFVLLHPKSYAPLAVAPQALWLGEVSTRYSSLYRTLLKSYRNPKSQLDSHSCTAGCASILLRVCLILPSYQSSSHGLSRLLLLMAMLRDVRSCNLKSKGTASPTAFMFAYNRRFPINSFQARS